MNELVNNTRIKVSEIVSRALKYIVEGAAVAVAAFFIPRRKMQLQEIAMISLTAAAILAILDLYSPSIAGGFRQGAGFGIGLTQVGFNPGASMGLGM